MRPLAVLLALAMTTVSLPAMAKPEQIRINAFEQGALPRIPSSLDSPLGRMIAQNDETDPNSARIEELDQRIAELMQERRKTRATGPAVVTVVGAGLTVGGIAGIIYAKDVCDDPGKDCNESAKDTLNVVFGIAAGIGGLMAIGGGVAWSGRLAKRRDIDREQEKLRKERRSLTDSLAAMRLGTHARAGSRYITLGFDF